MWVSSWLIDIRCKNIFFCILANKISWSISANFTVGTSTLVTRPVIASFTLFLHSSALLDHNCSNWPAHWVACFSDICCIAVLGCWMKHISLHANLPLLFDNSDLYNTSWTAVDVLILRHSQPDQLLLTFAHVADQMHIKAIHTCNWRCCS